MFINTLVGGLGKMERGQINFELPEGGGEPKGFPYYEGGSKKFCQIGRIMKVKMHNLSLKLTGYSLKLHLYFKIFSGLWPGPSGHPALCLTLKTPPLAQPQVNLAFASSRAEMCRIIGVEGWGYIPYSV